MFLSATLPTFKMIVGILNMNLFRTSGPIHLVVLFRAN